MSTEAGASSGGLIRCKYITRLTWLGWQGVHYGRICRRYRILERRRAWLLSFDAAYNRQSDSDIEVASCVERHAPGLCLKWKWCQDI